MDNRSVKKIRIQPLNKADFNDWLILWNAYLTFYSTSLPLKISKETWRKLCDDNTSIFGFGAYQNDKLVGIVHAVIHPNTWNDTEVCYLEDLYVAENTRGAGIGRALIQHVYSFADMKNCNRVYWKTQESNTTARKIYDDLATLTDMVEYRYDL